MKNMKPGNACDFQFDHSILRWDEGIPLGNGQIGCLIWGEPQELHLSLDRGDIWDVSVPQGTRRPEFTYEHLVKLAREKDTKQIREIFDAPYYYPVPSKLPAGRIVLRIQSGTDICSRLSLQKAEAELEIQMEDTKEKTARIQGFVHAARHFGMFTIEADAEEVEIELQNPAFGTKDEAYEYHYNEENREISQGSLSQIKYERPQKGRKQLTDGSYLLYFSQQVSEEFSYGVVAGVRSTAQGIKLCFQVASSHDGADWLNEAFAEIEGALSLNYGSMLLEHSAWWEDYWNSSSITVPNSLFEKQWYMSNYLLASCSRKGQYPMPLQGVWTADEDLLPPWKGDYHNDLNTQMSYYHYLKANHLPEGECFLDFLWDKKEAAEQFAECFYGTKGLCLPSVMTIDGQPLGGWPMYSLSPANQIWLGWEFEQYYRYTGDIEFLRERAYPYLQGIGECMTGLLERGEHGLLYLPISSSPEIHDDLAEAFVTPNSNYDLALLHYLFETLEWFSHILEDGLEEEYKKIRKCLPRLVVDDRHVLMISPDEVLGESHRHMSNAMAIHPLRLIEYEGEEERKIVDAVVADYERLGTENWTGFSYCWMAELYVIQRNGEAAARMLSIFWNYFCSPNGFHLNGDYTGQGYSSLTYRPFTLEANMCAADVLQEMLFYMQNGVMEFFPAVPKEWKEVSFTTLRGETGILASARLSKGQLCDVVLYSPAEQEVIILNRNQRGDKIIGERYKVLLKAGENKLWQI